MTTTAILTIGSELLCGDGLDTNSAWLSRRLEAIGCAVRLHLSCLDVMEDIVRGLEVAAELAEVVIVTGGLGPTVDDLTRAAVARYLDEPLVLDEGELAHIEALFARFSRTMSPNNRAQAERPQSARPLRNEVGSAPGFVATGPKGTTIYSLPGVPREAYWMWDRHLYPELKARTGREPRAARTFRTVGIGESTLAGKLGELEARPELEVRYSAEESLGTVRVTILADAESVVQEAWLEAREIAGQHLAATGNDYLPEATVALLVARGLTATTAESCTGGRVAAQLVEVAGASRVFQRGFVTYSNASKTELVGVPAELIEAQGAVCEDVARAMARGARAAGGTSLGLGITGIAGPGGGSEEKPVGTVHFAVAYGESADEVIHLHRVLPGTRGVIQTRAAAIGLHLLQRGAAALQEAAGSGGSSPLGA